MHRRRVTQIAMWLVVLGLPTLAFVKATAADRRADRAERVAAAVTEAGSPVLAQQAALRAVGAWAGRSGAVVDDHRDGSAWWVTVAVGGSCYEVAVENGATSAHPGSVPCPSTPLAVDGGSIVDAKDERAATASSFLVAWLTGDTAAPRWLADDVRPPGAPSPLASEVDVATVTGNEIVDVRPGVRSDLTVTADVTADGSAARQAWTVALVRGASRWDVTGVAGGEFPAGKPGPVELGRHEITTTTTRNP